MTGNSLPGVNGGGYVEIETHDPPCRIPEYKNGYFPARQVSLIPNSLIGRQQKLEACSLGYF